MCGQDKMHVCMDTRAVCQQKSACMDPPELAKIGAPMEGDLTAQLHR